jgi:transcriptional regulator with XRE-family HTH domain
MLLMATSRANVPSEELADAIGERFGKVVRELRDQRGWSQEQLAARAELNRSYMGEVERAGAMPSLATAAKLALALDVPLSRLIRWCEVSNET